eukprot:scaffold1359_cov183-Skeletonema_marinoi.AAC.11
MNYYPDRIADDSDDDVMTSCSAVETVEGGVSHSGGGALHQRETANDEEGGGYYVPRSSKSHPWKRKDSDDNSDNNLCNDDDDELEISGHGSTGEGSIERDNKKKKQIDAEKEVKVAHMIQHERDRRLGVVRNNNDGQINKRSSTGDMKPNENYNNDQINKRNSTGDTNYNNSSSNNLLGNIRGWFGGGAVGNINTNSNQQSTQYKRQQSATVTSLAQNTKHAHRASDALVESDDDSSSTSSDDCSSSDDDDSSNDDSNNNYAGEDLTPQERARIRALRYLSNSCVDAGRKAKTASYVRGLERLDLKRKRDRLEKELDIVETEMNKDRGLITNVESDCVAATAAKLVLELPYINSKGQVTTYDEYMAMMVNNDKPNKDLSSLWDDKQATGTYVSSLQSRLKEALERTRSQEKRLAILEQAGDEIIMSLCEDLVEVTSDSNKAEASYVKKGKALQMRRKREELRYKQKIKKAERHVRHLEERLLNANERAEQAKSDQSVASSDSSGSSDDDEQDNDEVRLEAKLSSIKSKIEENKADHKAEMESIRRQCEQLKLQLSVARLVMEGDENLREYVAILVRAHSKLLDRGEVIPASPQSITRARAKLLKAVHLENIYEQRLSVSKAFSDATINALEQELIERETSGQKMEVRCLNELVAIERETKALAQDANNRIVELEVEARELEETVAACAEENIAVASLEAQSVPATDDDSSSESSSDDEADDPQPAGIDRRDADLDKFIDGGNKSIRVDSRNDTPELESEDALASKHEEDNDDTRTSSSPVSDNGSEGVDADKQDVILASPLRDSVSAPCSDGVEDAFEASSDGNAASNCSEQGDVNVDMQALPKDIAEAKAITISQPSIDNSSNNNTDELEFLGRKLKDTLSQYQQSRDSTSAERVKHLTNMNLIVLEIAKAKGVDLESTPNLVKLSSWHRKKSDRKQHKEREKRRSRRSEKEKKRRREKGRRKQEDERNLSLVW